MAYIQFVPGVKNVNKSKEKSPEHKQIYGHYCIYGHYIQTNYD